MTLIQWLKFLFLVISFLSTNYIFLTIFLIYNSVFRIYDIHIYSITFKNILSLSSFLFFPSSYSFSFNSFPHFPFVFFLSLFSSFFSFFSQFVSFPQFGLPFPKSDAPVLRHFLLPCLGFTDIESDRAPWAPLAKAEGF